MSLEEHVTYLVRCDNCGRSIGMWPAKYAPQDVLVDVMVKFGWTVEDERTHCKDCPCACGVDEGETPHLCGSA